MLRIILLTLVLSLGLQAGDYVEKLKQMTWDELQSQDLEFEGPSYWFQGTQAKAFDVCLYNHKFIRTKNIVNIYEYDGDDWDIKGKDYLYTNIRYHQVDSDNVTGKAPYKLYDLNPVIKVGYTDSEGNFKTYFTRVFVVPVCE